MEKKAIGFELKDIDNNKRTAVIAHAVYDNIDLTGDISRKGMFTKSWNENKGLIAFYFNHDDTQAPGKVVDVWEDEQKAYTETKLGTHTLGNDVLIMMQEGVITKASFGYIATKSGKIDVKGKKVRELKEVVHIETSVLTKLPANLKAGVEEIKSFPQDVDTKALNSSEQNLLKRLVANDHNSLEELVAISASLDPNSDLYTWICWQIARRADMVGDFRSRLQWDARERGEIKAHIQTLEKFCRNTKASDETIKSILSQIEEEKQVLAQYDTADTTLITEPSASSETKDALLKQLLLLKAKL